MSQGPARSFIFSLRTQTVKRLENLLVIFFGNADAVVLHCKLPHVAINRLGADVNEWNFGFTILDAITNQVLQKLAELRSA